MVNNHGYSYEIAGINIPAYFFIDQYVERFPNTQRLNQWKELTNPAESNALVPMDSVNGCPQKGEGLWSIAAVQKGANAWRLNIDLER